MLVDYIKQRIVMAGPLSLADYMSECLFHPQLGYYTSKTPFGSQGDFTTSPEISQMFGELIGLAFAQYWMDIGSPPKITLAELGPGRGVLMADILRTTRQIKGFHDAIQVVMVEVSDALQLQQRNILSPYSMRISWTKTPYDLPRNIPLFCVANEFFDSLPIRQFTRKKEGWAETVVGLDEMGGLCFGYTRATPLGVLEHRLTDTVEGDVVELCSQAQGVAQHIGSLIVCNGGLGLFFDYGGWRSRGDTFQAVKAHEFISPLTDPGGADLTAHVDFEALACAVQPATYSYTTQGALLLALGLETRAKTLAQNLQKEALEEHLSAARRLVDPSQMGELFKVLALYSEAGPHPTGFTS